MASYQSRQPQLSPYFLNSFRLGGLDRLDAGYRFIRYSGVLDTDEDYEKKVRLLANILGGRHFKLPVEPVRLGREHVLAVIGEREVLAAISGIQDVSLTPEVVELRVDPQIHQLTFRDGAGVQSKLARRALAWSMGGFTTASPDWWSYDRRIVSQSADENSSNERTLVYPAFYFGFVPGNGGILELVIDPSVCYVERLSLFEKYGAKMPSNVIGKRYLYEYGNEWYKIDAVGISNPANKELMVDPTSGESLSIWDRIMSRWGQKGIPLIDGLCPDALTIAYKTRGQQSRRAHSGLMFELVGVDANDEGETSPHEESIMTARLRADRTEAVINWISSGLSLFGKKLNPRQRMRQLQQDIVEVLDAPSLRFGGDQEMATDLDTAGRDRLYALRAFGPPENSSFKDEQLIVRLDSMPDTIWKDFRSRFLSQLQSLSGESPRPTPLAYEASHAPTVREQARAIQRALGERRGYALLVLPVQEKASQQTKLHHYIKRSYWEVVHTQCADLETVLSFYRSERIGAEQRWIVRKDRQRLYQSYLRNLALGYLLVNSKWLWKLGAGSLRNQVHVGIDVYKGIAVFTFIYGDAELICFSRSKARRPEKLSSDQVREVLVSNLGAELVALKMMPSSIVFHRDGKIYDSELRGISQAVDDLRNQLGCLPNDVKVGIVEIHKTSSTRPRVYRQLNDAFVNPPMGLFVRLNDYEGALASTGYPMLKTGTARPLYFEIVSGDIAIRDIANDIYALTHLAFASPASCMRLPFTIALADFVLRESTPGQDLTLWAEEEEVIPHKTDSRATHARA